jgi:hypothetical protein
MFKYIFNNSLAVKKLREFVEFITFTNFSTNVFHDFFITFLFVFQDCTQHLSCDVDAYTYR